MNSTFVAFSEYPVERRRALFALLACKATRALADQAAGEAAHLLNSVGRLAEIERAMQAAMNSGEAVEDVLRTRISDLQTRRAKLTRMASDLKSFAAEQMQRFGPQVSQSSAVLIDGPKRIAALRQQIGRFESTRADMRERLVAAGLDEKAIERAGLAPTHEDRAAWLVEIEKLESQVERAHRFIASGPMYDAAILAGE